MDGQTATLTRLFKNFTAFLTRPSQAFHFIYTASRFYFFKSLLFVYTQRLSSSLLYFMSCRVIFALSSFTSPPALYFITFLIVCFHLLRSSVVSSFARCYLVRSSVFSLSFTVSISLPLFSILYV